jgi:uncharacterized membrane protein
MELGKEKPMAGMEASIVVDAPLREVYNQWTQFEDFPLFMEGVPRGLVARVDEPSFGDER